MPLPVPPQLEQALAAAPAARARFDRLPPEGKDAWIDWVSRPRAPWARRRRTAEAVRRLDRGRPPGPQAPEQPAPAGPAVVEREPPVLPPPAPWWPWLLAFALLLLVAALLVWLLAYRGGGGGRKSAGPTTVVRDTVPDFAGLPLAKAKQVAKRAKVVLAVSRRASGRPRGLVVGQKPAAGTAVPDGTLVTVFVSRGPPASARTTTRAGTTTAGTGTTTTATTPTTTAASTATAATTANATTTGGSPQAAPAPSRVAVPTLVGRSLGAALRALEQAGLLATVQYQSSQRPLGEVRGQNPAAGARVQSGTRVQVNAGEGPQPGNPTSVPDVTGEDESSATADLEQAGFQVVVVPTNRGSATGVVEQQPVAGATISSDDLVAIYVRG